MTMLIEVVGSGELKETHDLFIGTLGYESRSSHLARKQLVNARRKVALAFPNEDYVSYLANRTFLNASGYDIVDNRRPTIAHLLQEMVEKHGTRSEVSVSVLIDISSMSRPMLADIIRLIAQLDAPHGVNATFVYLPAAYVKGNAEHAPVAVSQPVTPEFAGWTSTPELPITAVVGLGYEPDLALGALEFLEPTAAWAFIPTGEDRRYDDAVKEANRSLEVMLSDDRSMSYSVEEPARVHAVLETLVYGLVQRSRPILIPFGPKIFSLCCLLIAQNYAPSVTVWRVSGETLARPGDRQASGKIVTMKVYFRPPISEE